MKNIKDLVTLPHQTLQHMVNGLLKQSKRDDFKINMVTYGRSNQSGTVCFGCAATCAVQEITGINLTPLNIEDRHEPRVYGVTGAYELEAEIDSARIGEMYGLFRFHDMLDKYKLRYDNRFSLGNENWREQLPLVEELIEELKQDGC